MEVELLDDKVLKSVGAELLSDDRRGLRIHGWEIETRTGSILKSSSVLQVELGPRYDGIRGKPIFNYVAQVLGGVCMGWEEKLQTSHLPEMVFGENSLILKHVSSGTKIHFNALDALIGWKRESLPPVEVPAAAQWKFRSKPFEQVILDYDYTFTTPYCGSEAIEIRTEKSASGKLSESCLSLHWEDCKDQIDVVSLASKEPILFYDEVVLYEDELADNGVSLLTVKVRVMRSSWFLLLRFWLRVDGVLMRLRDTRMHCIFKDDEHPVILRECCWRETSFQALSAKGYPTDSAAYGDPSIISQRLPVVMHKTQRLRVPSHL